MELAAAQQQQQVGICQPGHVAQQQQQQQVLPVSAGSMHAA